MKNVCLYMFKNYGKLVGVIEKRSLCAWGSGRYPLREQWEKLLLLLLFYYYIIFYFKFICILYNKKKNKDDV